MFTEQDVTDMTNLFDKFSTADDELKDLDEVEQQMAKTYAWTPLPERTLITAAAVAFTHKRGVEPIIHSKFSKKQRCSLPQL